MLKLVLFSGVAVCFFVCMIGFGLAAQTRVTRQRIKELTDEQKKKGLKPFHLAILRKREVEFMQYQIPLAKAYPITLIVVSASGSLDGLLWLVATWLG